MKGRSLLGAAAALAVAAPAAAYTETEVADGGTITGQVLLGSAQVETQTFAVTKDTDVCGTAPREVTWVRANGDALLDAVVFLEDVKAGKPFPEDVTGAVLDQRGCRFEPPFQVLANGGKIELRNSDDALHNIHAYELIPLDNNEKARRTIFNMSLFKFDSGITKTVKLRKGTALKLECDAHNFMHGWVFMARNPYYAAVDENGRFTIADVPPGTYVAKSWHGWLGQVEQTVKVEAGGTTEVTFSY